MSGSITATLYSGLPRESVCVYTCPKEGCSGHYKVMVGGGGWGGTSLAVNRITCMRRIIRGGCLAIFAPVLHIYRLTGGLKKIDFFQQKVNLFLIICNRKLSIPCYNILLEKMGH